ncbi:replicative DNA helicase [Niveibacterium sp.]|uniref:replicative DNA helicase n=1 Tax=Niveibacterium sp. TaxID=2017444 RepID=UPI0035B3B7FD
MMVESVVLPPHSIEAEQSVLGALLLDNQAWDRVADQVNENDFYRAEHRYLFRGARELIDQGKSVDVVTLSEWCERNSVLQQIGGLAYLAEIANNTPSSANIQRYAEIVRDRAIRRRSIAECHTAVAELSSGALEPGVILDRVMEALSQVAESGERADSRPQSAANYVHSMLAAVEAAAESGGKGLVGVSSGLDELDTVTLGLHAADMIVVAGRPSMGKTALALAVAEHVALEEKLPVAIFSMEMPGEQLVLRMTSAISGVEGRKIRQGTMTDDEWSSFSFAAARLNSATILIDETPALTPTELRARARRLHRRHGGLGLIVVDYLQLMRLARSSENRTQELSEISRAIKALAKELRVPVIALSQLNRAVEQRTDKRPLLSDLRESGAIEQDADLVVLLYRDDYYDSDSPDRGIAELIIAKHRNGPTGTVKAAFDERLVRFGNRSGSH